MTSDRVIVTGAQVERPAMPWTTTIHDLLAHVRAHAGPVVPKPVSVVDGVEIVSFLPGDAGPACWQWQATESGLRSAAVLLRRVHEATRSWHPPADARWSRPAAAAADVICHGDPGPWNMVWSGGSAIGLFDWDLAYPGLALDDVAYSLEYLTPFRSDESAIRWHGFTEPPDRPRRIASFAQAYGLPDSAGLVDAVLERQRACAGCAPAPSVRGSRPRRRAGSAIAGPCGSGAVRSSWYVHPAETRAAADRARAQLVARGVDPDQPADLVATRDWLPARLTPDDA